MNRVWRLHRNNLLIFMAIFMLTLLLCSPSIIFAKVTGQCSNCHTMHNSQNGSNVNMYGATGQPWKGSGPFPALVRGDCLGCHGMGTAENIDSVIGAPQVFHTDTTDLAGGNFAYILGVKGSGASDAKGHNVIDLGDIDDILEGPPGAFLGADHDEVVTNYELTCAGDGGCHGARCPNCGKSNLLALRGAHHGDVEGKITVADNAANSYRFLWGVKGLEDSDWQATTSSTDHNEYYGAVSPPLYDYSSCNVCHTPASVVAPQNTISGFCGTCHGNLHTLSGGYYGNGAGIGDDVNSPFQRHPTDIVLPATGEYSAYTSYSLEAPVARTSVLDNPSNTVTPGDDIVICLSCHRAHATDYPDMLRWDYNAMIANGGSNTTGCFTCHTTKDVMP